MIVLDDVAIAAGASVIVAVLNFAGIVWQNRKIKAVHDCVDELHTRVAIVAKAGDERDKRNSGSAAILSTEVHPDELPKP